MAPSMYGQKVGRALESQEGQTIFCFLVFIDLAVFTLLYVQSRHDEYNPDSLRMTLLSSLLTFTMFGFVIEIMTSIYSFKKAYFSHYGHVLDFCLTLFILYDNFSKGSILSPQRFLYMCRIPWRFGRLTMTIVQQVQQEHEMTKSKLESHVEESRNASMHAERMEKSYEKEKELRQHTEKILAVYKDEIDTLREALEIAARDVAGTSIRDLSGELLKADVSESTLLHEGDAFYNGNEESDDTDYSRRVVIDKDGNFDIF